jgi:hypothetical protein
MTQNISLNNTLEEELRIMLVQKQNECNALHGEIKALRRCVAEEQEGKYRAYIKFADLQKEFETFKKK